MHTSLKSYTIIFASILFYSIGFCQSYYKNYVKPSEILFLDTITLEGKFFYEKNEIIFDGYDFFRGFEQVFVYVNNQKKSKPYKSDYKSAVFVPIRKATDIQLNYQLIYYFQWLEKNNHSDFINEAEIKKTIEDSVRYNKLIILNEHKAKIAHDYLETNTLISEQYNLKIKAVKINLNQFFIYPFYKKKIVFAARPEMITTSVYLIINLSVL